MVPPLPLQLSLGPLGLLDQESLPDVLAAGPAARQAGMPYDVSKELLAAVTLAHMTLGADRKKGDGSSGDGSSGGSSNARWIGDGAGGTRGGTAGDGSSNTGGTGASTGQQPLTYDQCEELVAWVMDTAYGLRRQAYDIIRWVCDSSYESQSV